MCHKEKGNLITVRLPFLWCAGMGRHEADGSGQRQSAQCRR